jgi:hypothetical protein
LLLFLQLRVLSLRLQDRLYVLDEAIPNQPQVVDTAKLIEKTASERSLLITNLNIKNIPQVSSQEIALEDYERLSYPLTVTVVGDYLELDSLLKIYWIYEEVL